MKILTAIELFVAYVAENPSHQTEAAIADLVGQGIAPTLARDVVYLTPIAFGRSLLFAFGVHASNDFLCFRSDGAIESSGELTRHEVFQAAMNSVPQFVEDPSFKVIANSSSEVHAVKQAMRSGSHPGNLMLGPVCIFADRMTPGGMNLAQKQARGQMQPGSKGDAAKTIPQTLSTPRPWWRFW